MPCRKILTSRHDSPLSLEPHGLGTKYTALAMHRDEAGRKQHEQMGFHDGWGTALDQLVAHMKVR